MTDDLYCKIYIKTELSKEVLLNQIAVAVNGSVIIRTITTENMEIDLVENEDYSSEISNKPDEFLYYPFYLEIDPIVEINFSRQTYIETISKLLKSLWKEAGDAIAACDFEAQLPSKRG